MLGKPCMLSLSSTRLINSIKPEYSCKILYVKMPYLMVCKKNNPLFVGGWKRKIRPSGQIFLSHTHTHVGFFYSCINTYVYSCLKPLSKEQKSMFKAWDLCGWDWSFQWCFCSPKCCAWLFAKTLCTAMKLRWPYMYVIGKFTADTILFRDIQCKKTSYFDILVWYSVQFLVWNR